jgi:hypothetical protein
VKQATAHLPFAFARSIHQWPEGSDGVKQRQAGLAQRVREVRDDLYGPYGAQFLADDLGLPLETWANYERGVTIPAEVILMLIHATGVCPHWLLTGRGPKYPARSPSGR